MSPNPHEPEENFDQAANKFDLDRLRKALEAEKHREITPAAWKYFKGVLCGYTTEDIADKCRIERDSVQTALYRELRDFLRQILHPRKIQRMDWSSVPKWLTEAGYRLSNHYTNPPQNIPRSGVKPEHFVGRSHELKKLHQLLQQGNRVAIAAIDGMAGVGKTELAIQYALKHLNDYPGGVCWLPAKNPDMGIEIVRFARSQFDNLNPPEDWDLKTQVDFCWRRWQSGEVLVVLDDVTEYDEIEPYLPRVEPRFKVLVTTRIKRLGKSIESLLLDVLDEADALKLLIYHIGEERIQQQLEEAKKLCAWLEFLPLGLELVGRYLDRKPYLSLAEMLQRLEEKRLNERSLCKREEDMTAKRGVKAAFELSWETLNDESKQLGCLLSLFAPAPIPWYLVEQTASAQDPEDLEEIRDDILLNLHLLQRTSEGTYRLHQLIREFLQEKLKQSAYADELQLAFAAAMAATAKRIPYPPTCEEMAAYTRTMPHLEESATVVKDFLTDEDLIWPFIGLGLLYEYQGLYSQAEPWREQCLSVTKKRFGSVHLDVALSLNNLAYLYYKQGRYSEAESLFLPALALSKLLLEEDHPHVALSLNNLANLYNKQGRYSEAEPLYVQALAVRKRLLGDAHPDVAQSLGSLANLYNNQERYNEAEPLYVEVLELYQFLVDNNHPDALTALNNLANLYKNQGRYNEAEPLYVQALTLRKLLLGDDHPDVAMNLNNLAGLYLAQFRYSEAEPLYVQALALNKRLLGDNHPDVAISLNNLAALYLEQSRYSEAESLCLQALALNKRLLGDDHPDVARSLNNLALLYHVQSRFNDAEPLYVQSLELSKRLLGDAHPKVATILNNLASVYKSQGHYRESEAMFWQALKICEQKLGVNHPNTVDIFKNLARLLAEINSDN
jgi:tetratricopeptide (TPR) repeat protein